MVFGGHAQVGVLDVGAGAGSVAGCGEVADDAEGGGGVARDVGGGEEEDHDGAGRVGGIGGGGGAADDALEVGATEVPACAVRGPDLGIGLALCLGW